MTKNNHELARRFFNAIGSGDVPDELFTGDLQAWLLSSGSTDRDRFIGGIRLLAAAVDGDLVYDIRSLTAEEDRVVAEVTSDWRLINGERAQNRHIFLFRVRDGKIAAVDEYMDPSVPRETIGPLLQQMMENEGWFAGS